MQPAGRIDPQDWMTAPDTRAVVAALTADGQEVRFVGGCVRDALIERPVGDIDIATPDAPETVMALLRRAGLKAVPTGIEHGTVTAVSGHRPFEITTLREDVETYGRHARVAFTDDWAADAARRDFTMNAMFCAPDGTIYDPFGGWADLLAGHVRFVGDAEARVREDYLRLLRFFRFYARYGQGPPDAAALQAAQRHAGKLTTLAAERICHELLKFLEAANPGPAARVIRDYGILQPVLPEARYAERLSWLAAIEREQGVAIDPLRRMAAWLDLREAHRLGERLRLSKKAERYLRTLAAPTASVRVDRATATLRRPLHRLGRELTRDLYLLDAAERAAAGGRLNTKALAAGLAEIEAWQPKRLPVDGRDVTALGVAPGPRIKELLEALEEWWVDQDFQPGREACLAELKRRVAALPGDG
ncbi:CCA tRNA nucleotidyltransferase [Rhodovibrio salinarum]|uniref:CCA tRNA nucleotidyltransferase n=1 Tax=Rhodovibrio salinarum TaxID=1087 RepID=A0A934UYN8_9PROT|nr:CCA tRNA nucleotidyltransferase [Rhodovibrio salinarum]MBK1696252.1 CCA tRNA nucleotidyltransferase [Rhodovibrio salinarum]